MDSREVPSNFFSTVKYYVIGEICSETEKLLLQGGAQKHQYLSDILTHCIADKFDEEVVEAKELFQLNVVKSLWISRSLQCKTLLPAKAFDADFSRDFFTGITACPSQLDRRDHQIMWGLITMYGGECRSKCDKLITHLLTNSTSGEKYRVCNSKPNVKVVCTHWVLDSVSQKRKLPESQYHPKDFTVCFISSMTENSQEEIEDNAVIQPECLPLEVTPQQTDQQQSDQHPADLSSIRVDPRGSPTNLHPKETMDVKYYGHDPHENISSNNFLLGCIFHICDYQSDLGKEEVDLWTKVIEQYGGGVDDSYSPQTTHLLCEHQKSEVFRMALEDNKRIVTACWLNDCLVEKSMVVPFSILHVPQPFGKEKPCAYHIICLTNFTGSERTQIKKLILVLGAKYTGCLTRAVSVLVAKEPTGPKYDKAAEWNIPTTNADWLMELALGNLTALKLPLSKQFTNFECKGTSSMIEKISHLLNGWKTPLKVTKHKPKDSRDSSPAQTSQDATFHLKDPEVCETDSENKENEMSRGDNGLDLQNS